LTRWLKLKPPFFEEYAQNLVHCYIRIYQIFHSKKQFASLF